MTARIFLGNDEVTAAWSHVNVALGLTMERFREVLDQWEEAAKHNHYVVNKYTHPHDAVHAHIPKGNGIYARLDIGGSGAWMLDLTTGDIYSIKGYGKVDKKKVAGNILDPEFNGSVLFRDRFRRGRFDNRSIAIDALDNVETP